MNSVIGFLYGHYDSRGGATFLVAPSRSLADKNYAYLFGYQQKRIFGEDRWFELNDSLAPIPKSELKLGVPAVCDEDFLAGPITLELPDSFPITDLAKEVMQVPAGVELLYDYVMGLTPNEVKPYSGFIYAQVKDPEAFQLGDNYPDADNLIKLRLIPEPEVMRQFNRPTEDPVGQFYDADGTSWQYVDYGEDACGVVLQMAVDNPEVV